uniref:Retrovirus-related Pol polyprotein from transposon TNT 1-94 n=1 Tax=Tanacetum cinerariifolium TaxID=118510 RepID=A0A6L2J5H2_TANCI|nr:hypothetical protein [Tanacetum cinerariifolium]
MMGVLTHFLGFQINQSERGILIIQEKYVKDLLKKYDINGSSVKTPMVPPNNFVHDLNGIYVNESQYRDSDYVGCNMDRKSTAGDIELHFIPTRYQLADIFTKPLDEPTFKRLICELEVGVTTFRNAIGKNYLSHSSEYAEPPSIEIMEGCGNDNVTLNFTQIFSIHNWALKANQAEATKSPTDHSKETQSSSANDLNPSQPPTSTLVVAGLHKEGQQATCGPTALGVTRHDTSAAFTTEFDLDKSNPNDLVSQQQEKTKFASEGLETILAKPTTGKGASYIEKEIEYAEKQFNTFPDLSSFDDTKKEIKLEDVSKLVLNLDVDFMDLDSPEDDQPIIVEDVKKEEPEEPKETEDASASHPPYPSPSKRSPQPKGKLIKKDKGKKSMSSKDAEEEDIESDSNKKANLIGPIGESYKKKKLKKFDFITKEGDHIHFTEEQIKEQKRIEESVKVDLAKQEVEVGKKELVDLLASDLHLSEWREVMQACPNRKAAGWSTVYGSTKKFKSSVKYEDYPAGTVLNEPYMDMILFNYVQRQDFVTIEDFRDFSNEMLYTLQEIFFILHQGPRLGDHARTFSSLLLDEVDKRNLNPLKKIRAIKQLRQ